MDITKNGRVSFRIDMSCDDCKNGVAKLHLLSARNADCYASRNLKTKKSVDSLKVTPDYNANGIVTHFHIS